MQAIDAKGNTIWTDWNLSGSTIRLIIDQKFIDTAIYPITIKPMGDTFGYTSAGGTAYYQAATIINGILSTSPSAGTGTSISLYCRYTGIEAARFKLGLYDNAATSSLITNGYTGEVTPTSTAAWKTANFSSSPTIAAQNYRLSFIGNYSSDLLAYYDSGDDGDRYYKSSETYADFPDATIAWSTTTGSFTARHYSIYCTYTASAEVEIPTVTTSAASSVEATSATGNGNITDTGGENCTRRGFCYMEGTSGDPTTANSTAYDDGDYSTGAFTKSITGLSSGTSYRVRAYAVNSEGTGYGDSVTVLTKPSAS